MVTGCLRGRGIRFRLPVFDRFLAQLLLLHHSWTFPAYTSYSMQDWVFAASVWKRMLDTALTAQPNCRIIKEYPPHALKPETQVGKLLLLVVCAVLCVTIAAFMTVEVSHAHAGPVDAAHCQLCTSAHVAADIQPAWLTAYVLRLIDVVPVTESSPAPGPVFVAAFIRPPPFSV